ncbi:MAG: T9SS type A sorting domain-containing protein [Saprospiraceae bacterium]|nr:T9SS type A sorting domain-containing protein [Saprospiraceae bacterium]
MTTSTYSSSLTGYMVYPNPAQSILHVNADLDNVNFTIISPLGQVMKQGRINPNMDDSQVDDLVNGTYILKLSPTEDQKLGTQLRFVKF